MVFAPGLLGVVYLGGAWLHAVSSTLALLAFWELSRMFGIDERPFEAAVGYLGTATIAATTLGYLSDPLSAWVFVTLLAFLAVLRSPAPLEGAHHRVSNLLLAIAYGGALLPMLGKLRDLDDGLSFCLAAIFCTWGSDTGAYFVGKALGKRKLFELVSPKKTLEGALGGVACGGLVGLIVQQVFSPSLTELEAIGLGIVAAVVGAVGDLGESLLKRSTGIKDSSQLIPGHGGILDRFDGVMFSAGAVYLYLTLF